MVRPTPALRARLRLTTKQVNGGYYKGTRTGSMGAHTQYGGYIIDYRKVRHYNCPDLTGFNLTPFVTRQIEPTKRVRTRRLDGTEYTPKFVDGLEFLKQWRDERPDEYTEWLEYFKLSPSPAPVRPGETGEISQDIEISPLLERRSGERASFQKQKS